MHFPFLWALKCRPFTFLWILFFTFYERFVCLHLSFLGALKMEWNPNYFNWKKICIKIYILILIFKKYKISNQVEFQIKWVSRQTIEKPCILYYKYVCFKKRGNICGIQKVKFRRIFFVLHLTQLYNKVDSACCVFLLALSLRSVIPDHHLQVHCPY